MSYQMCMSVYLATTRTDLIFRSGKNGGHNSLHRILSRKTLSKQCTNFMFVHCLDSVFRDRILCRELWPPFLPDLNIRSVHVVAVHQ